MDNEGVGDRRVNETEGGTDPWDKVLVVVGVVTLAVLVLVTGVFLFYWEWVLRHVTPEAPGDFGAMFGALSALFTGYAFVVLTAALVAQLLELRLQRNELRLQRNELALSRKHFSEMARHQETSLRLRIEELSPRFVDLIATTAYPRHDPAGWPGETFPTVDVSSYVDSWAEPAEVTLEFRNSGKGVAERVWQVGPVPGPPREPLVVIQSESLKVNPEEFYKMRFFIDLDWVHQDRAVLTGNPIEDFREHGQAAVPLFGIRYETGVGQFVLPVFLDRIFGRVVLCRAMDQDYFFASEILRINRTDAHGSEEDLEKALESDYYNGMYHVGMIAHSALPSTASQL